MTAPKKPLLVMAIGLGAVAAMVLCTVLSEPAYKGKTLVEWLSLLDATQDVQQESAVTAIQEMGTNGIGPLVGLIAYDPEKPIFLSVVWRLKLEQTRVAAPFLWSNQRRNQLAFEAVDAIGILGPEAAPAIPQLVRIVEHGSMIPAARAVIALEKIGQPGASVLATLSKRTNYPPQRCIDSQRRAAIPVYGGRNLSEWFRNYDWAHGERNTQTVDAVRAIGTNAIPTLLKWISYNPPRWDNYSTNSSLQSESVLSDFKEGSFRSMCAEQAFAILGTNATMAIPDLIRLTDGQPFASNHAARALLYTGTNPMLRFPEQPGVRRPTANAR